MLVSSLLEAQMRRSLRAAKSELHKNALNDPLTGLPNRLSFEVALAQAVRDADVGTGCFGCTGITTGTCCWARSRAGYVSARGLATWSRAWAATNS